MDERIITLGLQEKKAKEEEHRTRDHGSLALRNLSNKRQHLYSGWSLSHTWPVHAYPLTCTLISHQMGAQRTFYLHQSCFQLHPLECRGLSTAPKRITSFIAAYISQGLGLRWRKLKHFNYIPGRNQILRRLFWGSWQHGIYWSLGTLQNQ